MSKRLKHNLLTTLIYSVMVYLIIIPLELWIIGISISIILGFLFGMLNDILTQLRKLNDEKFPNIDN